MCPFCGPNKSFAFDWFYIDVLVMKSSFATFIHGVEICHEDEMALSYSTLAARSFTVYIFVVSTGFVFLNVYERVQ
jgi:hypothetical protein